jgi:hypothetical protein
MLYERFSTAITFTMLLFNPNLEIRLLTGMVSTWVVVWWRAILVGIVARTRSVVVSNFSLYCVAELTVT